MESNQIKRKKSKERCADDVKRLVSAIENGVPAAKLKGELLRLRNLILDNQLQDFVIEKCGKDSLLFILETAQKFRKYKSKNEDEDKHESLGTNRDREKWLKWFRGIYGLNGKTPMEEKQYEAFLTAASYINFSELLVASKTDIQFHQNGLADCYSVAKREKLLPSPKKKSSNDKNDHSQDTRKEWGSVFKPARG